MRLVKKADAVIFAEDKYEKDFLSLPENHWLKKAIFNVIENLKQNAFCGEQIKKELIPKSYIKKYGAHNLFWYQLPNAWRLIYSVAGEKFETLVIVIEYFSHKNYERRFRY